MQTVNANTIRVLVAKHVPDLRRMEPHNIGVVIWSDHGIAAKFIGDDEGKIKGFQPGSSVKDWISYWKQLIVKSEVRDNSGKVIRATDPEFCELLKTKSKAQYALVDAGELLDAVETAELKDVADSLFTELVSLPPKKLQLDSRIMLGGKKMVENVREAINNSEIVNIKGWWPRYDWVCNTGKSREYFHFDYAVHDNGPQLIMQKVPWKPDKVYSTAYQFQSMSNAYPDLTEDKCVSLIFASEEDRADERIESAWNVLSRRGRVINVYDIDSAIRELNKLAS